MIQFANNFSKKVSQKIWRDNKYFDTILTIVFKKKLWPWIFEIVFPNKTYSSLVNKSGYLCWNNFCTEYILTQCCLHYLNQTHQKLGDLKEKLGRFIWKSVSVTFLDFSFYHNFSFCCVFFKPHELGCGGTL